MVRRQERSGSLDDTTHELVGNIPKATWSPLTKAHMSSSHPHLLNKYDLEPYIERANKE